MPNQQINLKAAAPDQAGQIGMSADEGLIHVAKGGGIAFIGTAGSRALSYIYSMALIWVLGAEAFGQFTLALAVVTFIGLLASIGFPQGIIRYAAIQMALHGKSGVHQVVLTALKVVIPVSLVLTGVMAAAAGFLAGSVFQKPELKQIIITLTVSIPFMSLQSVFLAATRAMKEMKYTTIAQIVQPLIALLLAFGLAAAGMGTNGASLAFVVSYIVAAALAGMYYLRSIPKPDRKGERFPLAEILKFSIPLSLTEWMQYANERLEIFFLGLLPGAVGISIYKIAWSLAGLETLLRLSLEQILAPYSSDLAHRREITQLEALYKTTAKWGFTAALMIFFVYVLFGRQIMGIFDPNLVNGAGILVILGLGQLFNEFTGAGNTVLIMSGRSGLSLLNTIILFVTSAALNWLLIPRLEVLGAAIAGAISLFLLNILRVLEVWWILKIHPFKLSFIKPVIIGSIAAGVIFLVSRFVYSGSLLLDAVAAVIFCLLFGAGIFLFRLDEEDKLVIAAMLKRFRHAHQV